MAGRADTQPLLRDQQRQEHGSAASSSRQEPRHDPEDTVPETNFEVGAQRIITWTLWLLLGAVVIGTVVGVVLVSLPMQQEGDPPPGVRKSSALIILHQENDEALGSVLSAFQQSTLHGRRLLPSLASGRAGGNSSWGGTWLVLWSGKGHHKTMLFNDLYLFDLQTKRWTRLYNLSDEEGAQQHLPTPRWKALPLYEPERNDMLVYGGDPLGAADTGDIYLKDLWRLDSAKLTSPIWQQTNSSQEVDADDEPEARRAHAGVILDLNGTSTLVMHGGRSKPGGLLSDVWATPLDHETVRWRCLSEGSSPDSSDAPDRPDSDGKHKKKRKRKKARIPPARKGHAAFAIPDEDQPRMIIWGGRNATEYFSDMWAFDVIGQKWEQWEQLPANGSSKLPQGRDHLGGFYVNGTIYIYGGRGGKEYNDSVPLDDLWAFNVATRTWTEVHTRGVTPAPRFLYSLDTYSVTNSTSNVTDMKMVIFGGESKKGCYLNDLWEYSLASNKWEEKSSLVTDQGKKCRSLEER